MAVKKTGPAEGEETGLALSASGSYTPAAVTPERAYKWLRNIHLATQIENLQVQIFPGRPDIWVEDADGEHDETLTTWIRETFEKCSAYPAMQIAWYETVAFGASVKSPGYVRKGGKLELQEIRSLPAHTFSMYPGHGDIQNELMPGIIINDKGETEIWQTQGTGLKQVQIQNGVIITDPTAPKPAGEAYAAPVYPIIAAIDFANKASDQQVNRVGAPSIFPMLESGGQVLETWAKSFVKNWGKNTSYVIPPGVSFPDVKIRESKTAAERLEMLIKWIESYFNPTTVLQKGNSMGASDKGAAQIWANYIGGTQAWIEEAFEDFFKPLLTANGYEDYNVRIELKRPNIDRSAEMREQVKIGIEGKAITKEEIRRNLSELELDEYTPELEMQVKDQYPEIVSAGFGNLVGEDVEAETQKRLEALHDEARKAVIEIAKKAAGG
jgi:hypothetical protein